MLNITGILSFKNTEYLNQAYLKKSLPVYLGNSSPGANTVLRMAKNQVYKAGFFNDNKRLVF